jgi:hypothetical protein
MPRSLALLLVLVSAVLATPAHAACDWVQSVANWNATLGWSWYSLKYTWTEPGAGGTSTTYEALTQDAGSAAGPLAAGFSGSDGIWLAEGTATGSLRFLDRLDSTSSAGHSGYEEYSADGPITGGFDPLPVVHLYLDMQTCTYHWELDAWAAGTFKTDGSSIPLPSLGTDILQSGQRPIPSAPGPLEFDGAMHASSNAAPDVLTPWFETLGPGANRAENNAYAPRALLDASMHWRFAPGPSAAPDNDACTGARVLLGSDSEDASFATSAPTDPASACGAGDRSVWFFFLPEATGTAQISTSGSDDSTVISVWQVAQTCAGLTMEVACGANRASVPVQAGVPLYVQVQRSAGGGPGGNVHIQLTPEPPAGPVVGWGYSFYGQPSPPPSVNGTAGLATAIAAGPYHSCAIQAKSGAVICWGDEKDGEATPPDSVNGTAGTASAISAGEKFSCAIQAGSGAVVCWGNGTGGAATPPAAVNGTAGGATAIAAGIGVSCAIQEGTGAVVCWGDDSGTGAATPPPSVDGTSGAATAIAAGRGFNCAIRASDRGVVCWGRNEAGESTPPAAVNGTVGRAQAIMSAANHTCALQAETGDVVCWGSNGYGQISPPDTVAGPAGTASAVATGETHSCAIRADHGAVVCWGDDFFGQSTPPAAVNGVAGAAIAIAASEDYTLAIRTPEPGALALGAAAVAAVSTRARVGRSGAQRRLGR